jgi:hypothetical protein
MALTFQVEDERPVGSRGRTAASLTDTEQAVQAAYRQSCDTFQLNGTVLHGVPMSVIVNTQGDVDELRKAVTKIAKIEDKGYRFREQDGPGDKIKVVFWATQNTNETLYAVCPECEQNVAVTTDMVLRVHGPRNDRCVGSGAEVKIED